MSKIDNQSILEELISGEDAITKVEIQNKGNIKEICMKPLTDGELSRLKSMEKDPVNVNINFKPGDTKRKGFREKLEKELKGSEDEANQEGSAKINSGEMSESQDATKYFAIAMSMSIDDNDVDPEFIKKLDAGVPDLLFEKVIEISNLNEDSLDTVKQFLKNR